jgi:acyl-coenzyme A synthetase/AMP-(fatty) acid ligase
MWPAAARLHPRLAVAHLGERTVTHLQANPTYYRWLVDPRAAEALELPATLGVLGSGGGDVSADLRETCRRAWGMTIWNHLGSTETASFVASESAGRAALTHAALELRLREPGGELDARGPGLLWGTWQAGTGPNPRAAGDWEPTGDLGRWADDGSLVWVGRDGAWFKDRSSQKVGFAEVERALWETGLVADCAVIADGDDGARAVVVAAPSANPATVTARLRARLGRERVPVVDFVAAIERTLHGKLVPTRHAASAGPSHG